MLLKLHEIIKIIETWSPIKFSEDFDNIGLIVGDRNSEIKKALITIDTTEKVVEEALKKKCNLIISFHPIIFHGLKKLTEETYVERTVRKAIKNNINREFTPNSVTKIAEQQIRDNLDREILKEAKKLLQEIDRNELSELTKEVSKVASEVASDPSVKQSGSILDKKFGNITVKQLIGACRSRGNC